MKAAAQGGMAEVALGKVAEQNGANPNVKQFGTQMVIDHSQANHELKMIAAKQGVALPKGLGPKNDALKAKLSRLHGAAFDRAYVKAWSRTTWKTSRNSARSRGRAGTRR